MTEKEREAHQQVSKHKPSSAFRILRYSLCTSSKMEDFMKCVCINL